MLKIIYGKKGSGKSKILVDMANTEVSNSKGDIIYIDDDSRPMYDLRHEIRFIDLSEYDIDSQDRLYGMICGMLASNYDISTIYMDGIKHIIEKDLANTERFFKCLAKAVEDINFVMIISGEPNNCPEFIKEYIS